MGVVQNSALSFSRINDETSLMIAVFLVYSTTFFSAIPVLVFLTVNLSFPPRPRLSNSSFEMMMPPRLPTPKSLAFSALPSPGTPLIDTVDRYGLPLSDQNTNIGGL